MSLQRRSPVARWTALSGADRFAAALWGALALLLAGVAVVALARSGPHAAPPRKAVRIAPAAIPHAPASSAEAPLAVFPGVDATGTASSEPAATASASATPPATAADVPDAALVPPGATLLRRVNVSGPGGADRVVAEWQTAAAAGCLQPHISVLGKTDGGQWGPIWDAGGGLPGSGPLIPPAALSGDRCFPEVGLFTVQPLDGSGAPYLTFSLQLSDGSQRLISRSLVDPAATPPAIVAVPAGARLTLADGVPAALQLSFPVAVPPGTALAGLDGQPIGHEDELQRWQIGGFQPGVRTFALNCLAGSVITSAASNAGVAIAYRCPDGTVAAVAVTAGTQIAPNLLIGGLQPGDDLNATLLPADPPACPAACAALPIAASVSSQAAVARQAQPPAPAGQPSATAPAAPAATAPPAAAPPRASAPAGAAPQPRSTAPAPAATVPAAPAQPIPTAPAPAPATTVATAPPATNPTANGSAESPARPIPTQPTYVPPRPIPTQPR